VRTAVQALAAVLGGAQSLHTNALDEALALPTEEAALLALRTQQILAYETGITDVVDPLGGSYAIERLTADLEAEARRQFSVIDGMGGMVAAIEAGYPQREIAESAYRDQQAVESRARTIVGVNAFVAPDHEPVKTLYIDEAAETEQRAGLERLRRERDADRVRAALQALQAAAAGSENTMPRLLEAVRAYATLGEMCDALREVWGEYQEVPII
jgi:methylmalonyl-CoA mutase N-terminal domain/subunit